MDEDTLFLKIVRGEVPADIVYRDELVTAFRDIAPQAPVHVLIVPNRPVPSVAEVGPEHEPALGRMFTVARRIAEAEGIAEDGFRLIVNTHDHAGQEVYHLHLHLIGGRPLGPMLSRAVRDGG
jgi:histidine triad (HIT) family protein